MIPQSLINKASALLSVHFNKSIAILHSRPVSGGSINEACCLETTAGKFFLKWNNAQAFPGMFDTEVKGLQLLKKADAIAVPGVILTGISGNDSFLVLEWMEPGKRQKDFFEDFGSKLAALHRATADEFGLDHDNYIGSLLQSNRKHKQWIDFFVGERIEPQIRLSGTLFDHSSIRHFENLFSHLPEIFPEEKPALLHGDLWSGNYLTGPDGFARLIDPAIYYGHREMDLAMTKLFGGFDPALYESYHRHFPLSPGWQERTNIFNLYPLLVHVNLFGGGYVSQVKEIIKKF